MTTGPNQQTEVSGAVPAMAAPAQPAAEAAQKLERTLEHFESMLAAIESQVQGSADVDTRADSEAALELAGLGQAINDMLARFDRALDRLAEQTDRLSRASDLVEAAKRVESRMIEIAEAFRQVTAERTQQPAAPSPQAGEPAPVVPAEPQFQPSDTPVGVVLAAVPGFQGLMDTQRALSALPQTEGASVVAFKNGEASLEVILTAPVSARQIVDGLREATGEQLLIEESRPEAERLRLRFVDRGAGATA